jgi:hypothetical protein
LCSRLPVAAKMALATGGGKVTLWVSLIILGGAGTSAIPGTIVGHQRR